MIAGTGVWRQSSLRPAGWAACRGGLSFCSLEEPILIGAWKTCFVPPPLDEKRADQVGGGGGN